MSEQIRLFKTCPSFFAVVYFGCRIWRGELRSYMSESQLWRELLAEIIKNPQERQRVAAALDINQFTLMRWIRNESTPRESHLHRLIEVIPQLQPLIAGEFDALSSVPAEAPLSAIPITFFNHILELYATSPDAQRFWSICSAVLHEARKHLTPNGASLNISVVRCLAPYQGNIVRCLREYAGLGLGTSQWREQVELGNRFFGAESLAGYVVESGHSVVIADLSAEQRVPHQLPEEAYSAAAAPILHASRIAGCLLISSTRPDYFSLPALPGLLESYAALLALAFDPEDFYEPQSIQLGIMPSVQVQESYLATIQQHIRLALTKALADHRPISFPQAEQQAWWQIAEELLRISPRLSAEI